MRLFFPLLTLLPWLCCAEVVLQRIPDGGVQPQVCVDAQGGVHLVYTKGDGKKGDVLYAFAKDGVAFSTPVRVNTQPDTATIIGNIRGAQLALGKGGRVHVAWNGKDGMYYTRSKDGGGFEPERNVSQAAKNMDGGGSVAADANGNVFVVWHASLDGEKGEGARRVWIAKSADEGRTFAKETPAWNQPTGACGCCNLKAFVDAKGVLSILYRSATDVVNRDVYLLQSRDGGKTFSGSNIGAWKIGACPMSTMFIAETPKGVLGTWETRSQIHFGPLSANLKEGAPAPGMGKGRKYSVLAANARGETLLAWTEGMAWERGGAAVWQVFDAKGAPTSATGRKDGVPVWGLIAAYARPDGTFVIVY